MVAPPGAAGHREHQDALAPFHERGGLGEIGGGRPAAERQALAASIRDPEHPAGAACHFRDGLVAEAVQDLVKGRVHRRQGCELPDQRVALRECFLAQDRMAVGACGGAAHQVPVGIGERFLKLHGEGVGEEVEDGLAGCQVDAEIVPFRGRYLGDAPLHQRLAGGHELDDGGPAGVEIGLDRADQ